MRNFVLPILLVLLLCAGVAQSSTSVGNTERPLAKADPARQLYIVQFAKAPATRALSTGNNFDAGSPTAQRYLQKLKAEQNAVLAVYGLQDKIIYSYGYSLNGVAASLSTDEVRRLRRDPDVVSVRPDQRRVVATNSSPQFLGLTAAGGGLRADLGLTGENIIVGIIDTGITPGHPSFKDRKPPPEKPRLCEQEWMETSLLGIWLCRRYDKPGVLYYDPPPVEWRGSCETGPGFDQDDCNNKVIGARFYRSGFEQAYEQIDANDPASPADADGHGTHVASIVAGNSVDASVYGKQVGKVSGIAPRARIAVYKACWLEPGKSRAECSMADLQKAIEDAIADGVHIINYSIGDPDPSIGDADDFELLAAAEAGVLSVVSVGNKTADNYYFTVESPATTPWVISVGATSRAGSRVAQAIQVDAPQSLAKLYESREAGMTPRLAAVGPIRSKLVLVNDASTATDDPDDNSGTSYDGCTAIQNSGELRGKVALIQRGYCNFDLKIANAAAAGARAAMIFSNDMNLLVMTGDANLATIPAVMIDQANGQLLRDSLLTGATVEVTLDKSLLLNFEYDGNEMGSFSGRGPNLGDPDFLKPDVVAPGTAILGGQTPDVANGFRGEWFQYLTGTSQAAPHVAGVAALLLEANPDWSPAEIKSALMTSSRQDIRTENDGGAANPFDMGSGHIVPNSSASPGLLYPVHVKEYDAYLCSIDVARLSTEECAVLERQGYQQDARDINLPSIAITELAGSVTLERRVKNVGPPAQFALETNLPPGISLEVVPDNLSLGTNESKTFTLQFTADGADLNEWSYGSYSWVSDTHKVYSPFVVQPTLFTTIPYVFGVGSSGSLPVEIGIGYNGTYAPRLSGPVLPCLLPFTTQPDGSCLNTGTASVADDSNDEYVFLDDVTDIPSITRFRIDIEDTDDILLRVALLEADALTDTGNDLDIYMYFCAAVGTDCVVLDKDNPYASATPGTSEELIDIYAPTAGTWVIDVHGYNTLNGESADFRLYAWAFGGDLASDQITLANIPAGAKAGTNTDISVNWQDLPQGLWLGGINHYGNDGELLDVTLVEIDNTAPLQ